MPRHSRVDAALGGSQVMAHPPSACWSRSIRSRWPSIVASSNNDRHALSGAGARCRGVTPYEGSAGSARYHCASASHPPIAAR